MPAITRNRLNEFVARHPGAAAALDRWYRLMKPGFCHSFAELRAEFPSADRVGRLPVLNISGNRVWLIAAVHDSCQRVYIRAVLTHAG